MLLKIFIALSILNAIGFLFALINIYKSPIIKDDDEKEEEKG